MTCACNLGFMIWGNMPLSKHISNVCRSHHHLIYSLTTRVLGAPQMISQPVFSIFPCSALPSGTWQTPGLSIPWYCLPTSSSFCLVFFPRSLCLAKWFRPDLMNGKHVRNTAVCASLRWSGGLRVVQFPIGFWRGLPLWYHGLCMRFVKTILVYLRKKECLSVEKMYTGLREWVTDKSSVLFKDHTRVPLKKECPRVQKMYTGLREWVMDKSSQSYSKTILVYLRRKSAYV